MYPNIMLYLMNTVAYVCTSMYVLMCMLVHVYVVHVETRIHLRCHFLFLETGSPTEIWGSLIRLGQLVREPQSSTISV